MTSKLALAVIALLAAAVLVGLPVAALQINATADQVVMTPTVYVGDADVLAGLHVGMQTTLNNHLFWTSDYTPADGSITTAYDFSPLRRDENIEYPPSGVRLENSIHHGYGSLPFDGTEMTGLLGAYSKLYQETPVGERREMTINLADYYDYYPITGRINFGHTSAYLDWEDAHLPYTPTPESDRYLGWRINQYFKLPLLADTTMTISIEKGANGNTVGIGSTSSPDAIERTNYSLSTASVVLGDDCYFTLDGWDSTHQPIDTSQIEGGYGIYRISLRNGRIDADSIANVYPLDIADGNPFALLTSPDERHLLLYRRTGTGITLTVLELATMQPIQTLSVVDGIDPDSPVSVENGAGYHILLLDYGRLLLLDADANGHYTLRIDIPVEAEGQGLQDATLTAPLRYSYPTQVTAWDGERLAIADYCAFGGRQFFSPCDLYLAVLTADGLAYLGIHASSLNTTADAYNSNEAAWPTDHPLSVCWE